MSVVSGASEFHHQVELAQGKYIGERVSDYSDVIAFKGIPYARPPVGQLRWKPALPLNDSDREFYANRFSPACLQPQISSDSIDFFHDPLPLMSEDCLYLNVWAPQYEKGKKYPVMVWFHGGSLVNGEASAPLYNGAELAKKGVVVVTVNYRLGVFGYFSHPELSRESEYGASGNYGTSDQIQSLRWVQENIPAFNGDNSNVTIFGESAGAYSVTHLLLSPLAKDLFHKAIAQSPYLRPLRELKSSAYGLAAAEEVGKSFANEVGAPNLQALRSIPAEQLVEHIEKRNNMFDVIPTPVIDGRIFTDQLFNLLDFDVLLDIPVLFGFNSDEGYHMGRYCLAEGNLPASEAEYIRHIKNRYGDLTNRYLSYYPFSDKKRWLNNPFRDGFFGWAAEKYIRAYSQLSSKAYLYFFDHQWPSQKKLPAFHSAELPFVFNNVKHKAKYAKNMPSLVPDNKDLSLAEMMSDYWVNFAKNGSPDAEGLPEWEHYSSNKTCYMHFKNGGAELGVELNPGLYEFYEQCIRHRQELDISWGQTELGVLSPLLDPVQQPCELAE